jgi:bacterioferritin-associated ferredoxin
MYVCLCNAITDRDFRAHAHAECEGCTVSTVYRSLGKKPQCGKCVPFVRQLLRRAVDLPRPEPAVAAG